MMHDMMQELLCTTFKCTEIHKGMMHEHPMLISQPKLNIYLLLEHRLYIGLSTNNPTHISKPISS